MTCSPYYYFFFCSEDSPSSDNDLVTYLYKKKAAVAVCISGSQPYTLQFLCALLYMWLNCAVINYIILLYVRNGYLYKSIPSLFKDKLDK